MKKGILVIILSFFLIGLSGCQSDRQESWEKQVFWGFDTWIEVTVPSSYSRLLPKVKTYVQQLDQEWNRFSSSSLISKINDSPSPCRVDKDTFHLIELSWKLKEKTGGFFHIGIASLVDLWGFSTRPRVPSPAEIEKVLAELAEFSIVIDYQKQTVTVENGKIDLGGIAKGYLVDYIANFLRKEGVTKGLINAGGTVTGWGKKWKVGVAHPRQPELLGYIMVDGQVVSTSGDYFRYLEKEGKRYSHILNPFTGYPKDDFLSATVVAENGALADALSTAIMAGGWEALSSIRAEFPQVGIVLVEREGIVYLSPSVQPYFTLSLPELELRDLL